MRSNTGNKQDTSLSSIGSSLTDEALEKEEELKKAKRKYRVLRDALKKEKQENDSLVKENNALRKKLGEENSSLLNLDAEEPGMSKKQIEALRDEIEKEVYSSK